MEPVSLIVGALAAGGLAGAQQMASDAVKDAYAALRGVVSRRFGHEPAVREVLDGHEATPEQWQAALTRAGAGGDDEVVAAAQRLMTLVDPAGARVGRYVVDASNAKGVQVGDNNTQHNTFN